MRNWVTTTLHNVVSMLPFFNTIIGFHRISPILCCFFDKTMLALQSSNKHVWQLFRLAIFWGEKFSIDSKCSSKVEQWRRIYATCKLQPKFCRHQATSLYSADTFLGHILIQSQPLPSPETRKVHYNMIWRATFSNRELSLVLCIINDVKIACVYFITKKGNGSLLSCGRNAYIKAVIF